MLLLLLACSGKGDTKDSSGNFPKTEETAAPTDPDTTPAPTSLRDYAEAADYLVQDGLYQISDYSGCCDDGADCLGNNPATPYGTWAVPPGVDEVRDHDDPFLPWGETPEPLGRTFRLRQDEAIVWTGTAPPKAAYFSVRSYLGTRTDNQNEVWTLGSLGPSGNHLVMEEQQGTPPWGEPLAVVTTANATVEAEVIAMLEELGFDESQVIRDQLPGGMLRLGLYSGADTFQIVSRAAVYDDPAAGEAWLADPGASVWRLTPNTEKDIVRHPEPVLPPRGTGDDESEFVASMDAIQTRLGELYGGAIVEQTEAGTLESLDCIQTGLCAGDIRDRMAIVSSRFYLAPGDIYLAWGVNHTRSGKASYSNLTVVSEEHKIGVASKINADMPGTAQYFGYDGADADELFVFAISRNCSALDGAPCIEVPYGCPGAGLTERMWVTSRAYLEPTTGAAPAGEELTTFRIAKVTGAPPTDTGTSSSDTGSSTSSQ